VLIFLHRTSIIIILLLQTVTLVYGQKGPDKKKLLTKAEIEKKHTAIAAQFDSLLYSQKLRTAFTYFNEHSTKNFYSDNLHETAAWLEAFQAFVTLNQSFQKHTLAGPLRRGSLYVKLKKNDTLTIQTFPVRSWQQPLQMFGPQGKLLFTFASKGKSDFIKTFINTAQSGVFRIAVKETNATFVYVNPSTPLVVKPVKEFTSFYQNKKCSSTVYFYIDSTCSQFRLFGTTHEHMYTSSGHIKLTSLGSDKKYDMHFKAYRQKDLVKKLGAPLKEYQAFASGKQAGEYSFKGYRLLIDSITISDPKPGFWRVESSAEQWNTNMGFWLEGTHNYFSPDTTQWFIPTFNKTSVRIKINASQEVSQRPLIGAVWSWPSIQKASCAEVKKMHLSGDKIFIWHSKCEPVNDNSNPDQATDKNFFFNRNGRGFDYRLEGSTQCDIIEHSLITIVNRAPWLIKIEKKDKNLAAREFAEFAHKALEHILITKGISPKRITLQLFNEPNSQIDLDTYLVYLKNVGKRLKKSPYQKIRSVQIGAPALGQEGTQSGILNFQWLIRTLQEADEYVDVVIWNQYCVYDLEDTRDFGVLVNKTNQYIAQYNSDNKIEPIFIGATNMRGGVHLQRKRQDGFYGALWWLSTLSEIINAKNISGINYFYLFDNGARAKGLLFEDKSWKPVAHAMKLFNERSGSQVLEVTTNHRELKISATLDTNENKIHILFLNSSEVDMLADTIVIASLPSVKNLTRELLTFQSPEKPVKTSIQVKPLKKQLFFTTDFPAQSISFISGYYDKKE